VRKWLAVALLVLGLPLESAAQIIPHAAIFGGYTFVRAQYNGGPGAGFNLNGWDGSLELKPASWLGFVAEMSRQYGSPNRVPQKQTTVLFGPQISVPGIPRLIPYAHIMAGVVHGTNEQLVCVPELPSCGFLTGNAFATAVGGGLDIKLLGPLWLRAVQADWLHGDLSPDHQTQARLATGIVIRFGR
jgi:hypothetical protein